ncbi:MAG TPA: ribosome small subunit-dependent GTPase A [Chthonomonadales bacterium]|nr:ribosome small subunit-dependent GTPase A [Chthonomonadales bacterium]
MREGIVLRAVSGVYTVQINGRTIQCTLRGNLKKEFQYTTSASHARRVIRAKRPYTHDTVSVGDRVRIVETGRDMGVIEEVLPRRSRLVRAGFRGREQTIVCNLDQLVIVFACAAPNPDVWKLDRFLIAAEAEGLEPLIVANKRDLVPVSEWRRPFVEFEAIGYRVLPTSAKMGEGIEALRDALREKVSAFVGPSGVGKSSLLNVIQPGLRLRTGDIGHVTYKGRHVTTATQLIPLHSGGWVADTPGLRQLELLELDRDELAACFVEFKPYLGECRFPNCRHEVEPGCALQAAVDKGEISPRRFQSFLQLAAEMESRESRPR